MNKKQRINLAEILDDMIDYAIELKHCWEWKSGEKIAGLDMEYDKLCADIERAKTFRVELSE